MYATRQSGGSGHAAAPGLLASGLTVSFEALRALDGAHLAVTRGEVLGLIGPNGSGKTTCLNVLSGFVQPDSGRVVLDGRDLTSWSPERRVRAGLTRTFQGTRLFGALTVSDNVHAASILRRRGARARTDRIIRDLGLADHRAKLAGSLPPGVGHRVALARALASEPAFLLLDEPAAGMNEAEGEELAHTIRRVATEHGCGVLLIEHDMRVITGACDRVTVLDSGRVIATGRPEEVSRNRAVVEAYFGTRGGHAVG